MYCEAAPGILHPTSALTTKSQFQFQAGRRLLGAYRLSQGLSSLCLPSLSASAKLCTRGVRSISKASQGVMNFCHAAAAPGRVVPSTGAKCVRRPNSLAMASVPPLARSARWPTHSGHRCRRGTIGRQFAISAKHRHHELIHRSDAGEEAVSRRRL